MREPELLVALRQAATTWGHRLFRNNVGRLKDVRGRWVQYGIPGEGGSDLIGWTSILIDASMLGQRVAVFTAIEAKAGLTRTTEEQRGWLEHVRGVGGIAGVARSVKDFEEAIDEFRRRQA